MLNVHISMPPVSLTIHEIAKVGKLEILYCSWSDLLSPPSPTPKGQMNDSGSSDL